MIDLHYWTTPNGHKITIFLEEAELPYRIVPVNISKGAQFEPEFLAISPNNRIPAIVDRAPKDAGAPISVFDPALSSSISPKRLASICRAGFATAAASWSGCCGKWRGSGRWQARTITSRTMRRRRFPTRSGAT